MNNWMSEIIATAWLGYGLIFCLGACVGSFLNVCIVRLPKGESLVRPRSHNEDGDPIAWYDNIPVVSWFVLRGRDRKTGKPFSFGYPLVEALVGALFVACALVFPWQEALAAMVLCALLVGGSFIDLKTLTLPDGFTVGGAAIGLVVSVCLPGIHVADGVPGNLLNMVQSLMVSATGVVVGGGFLLWLLVFGEKIFRKPVMGEGDVLLGGCIGAFCGWQGAVFALFGGSIIALAVILPLMLVEYFKPESAKRKISSAKTTQSQSPENPGTGASESPQLGFGSSIPFGPWLALGALGYLFWAAPYVDAYFSRIKEVFLLMPS